MTELDSIISKLARGKKDIHIDTPHGAWTIIREANRIFGPLNWSREILEMRNAANRERDAVLTSAYVAKVRIRVDVASLTVTREAHGCGEGRGTSPFEAHDRGLKAAELDATARALATLGKALGLVTPTRPPGGGATPKSQKGGSAPKIGERVETSAPPAADQFTVTNGSEVRVKRAPEGDVSPKCATETSFRSRLKPRRLRSPQHLAHVRSHPCLVCERKPVDAHHLRFAQPTAMGRKVSDEFTVPLCRICHDRLHRDPNEEAWWEAVGIDALAIANELWDENRAMSEPRV